MVLRVQQPEDSELQYNTITTRQNIPTTSKQNDDYTWHEMYYILREYILLNLKTSWAIIAIVVSRRTQKVIADLTLQSMDLITFSPFTFDLEEIATHCEYN